MRKFNYFLYENFDTTKERDNQSNPRLFFNAKTDNILSNLKEPLKNYADYDYSYIKDLADIGIIKFKNDILYAGCPIFYREDAKTLLDNIQPKAIILFKQLSKYMQQIRNSCSKIKNGFAVETNLYHIICGMIFDGYFFDYLTNKKVLSTSHVHANGLDYIAVIYEQCKELQDLSNNLLCSYNRISNTQCALQSFGDANGTRFDFYKFFQTLHKTSNYEKFSYIINKYGEIDKNSFLSNVYELIKSGNCSNVTKKLLDEFGYTDNGTFVVPVFLPEHTKTIFEIEDIIENALGKLTADLLDELSTTRALTPVKHDVTYLEIANELYHILFGTVNEKLVTDGYVDTPPNINGEGRYLKCIEVY